jgi:hypothetical protein
MKHEELFNKHAPRSHGPSARDKRRLQEGSDRRAERARRASFKSYLRTLEEDLAEEDLEAALDDDYQDDIDPSTGS